MKDLQEGIFAQIRTQESARFTKRAHLLWQSKWFSPEIGLVIHPFFMKQTNVNRVSAEISASMRLIRHLLLVWRSKPLKVVPRHLAKSVVDYFNSTAVVFLRDKDFVIFVSWNT